MIKQNRTIVIKATIQVAPFNYSRAFSAPKGHVPFSHHCSYTWKLCLPASVTFEMAILPSSPSVRINVGLLGKPSSWASNGNEKAH